MLENSLPSNSLIRVPVQICEEIEMLSSEVLLRNKRVNEKTLFFFYYVISYDVFHCDYNTLASIQFVGQLSFDVKIK